MKRKLLLLAAISLFIAGCSEDSSTGDNTTGQTGEAQCGNTAVEDGESCDDGNENSGDGCSSDCKTIETGYSCPETGGKCTKNDSPEPTDAKCGNSKVEADEACDDGNTQSNDGCSSDCKTIEDGYECPNAGEICVKKTTCGDSQITGDEVCDDGNDASGDGCSSDCKTIENGYHCTKPGEACVLDSCGNGILNDGEECDDGYLNIEYGIRNMCSLSCHPAHYCGDGLLDKVDIDNGEECDAGADTSSEYNGCTDECQKVNYCGDGRIQSENEQCDDGNSNDGDGCSSTCQMEANYACKTENGKSICALISCGNGKLDANEQCDDGNRQSGDGCSKSCSLEKGWICEQNAQDLSECRSMIGDGIISAEAGEECDDGNTTSNDGCSEFGRVEPGWICPDAGKACIAKACGDNILAGTEECDDGNAKDGDGCSSRCRVETGWKCDENGKNCAEGRCGDGIVQVGEECDNDVVASGKPAAGDGCSDTCTIEAGYECKESGGECHAVTCGDGKITATTGYTTYEQCDLGTDANNAGAGCTETCRIVDGWHCDSDGKNCQQGTCGDHILDAGEECDDGNQFAGDGCNPACEIEAIFDCVNDVCKAICGDGLTLWQAGEECDDGNLINGDGCSSDCKIEKGYQCTDFSAPNPSSIQIPMIYRDFRAWNEGGYNGTGTNDGYLSQTLLDSLPNGCKQSSGYRMSYFPTVNMPLPDFNSYCEDQYCQNTVYDNLSADKKPMLRPSSDFTLHPDHINQTVDKVNLGKSYTCPEVFDWWYRDIPGLNLTIHTNLTLTQDPSDSEKYHFASNLFFPIVNQGYHSPNMTPRANDSGKFTSEFITYFKYKGGETLIFDGDDDAWVFINDRLALDLGCMHVHYQSPIVLDETMAKKLNIFPGGIYSIRMFHAERCSNASTGSIYEVTLSGFVNMGKSECTSICGDGIIRGNEECDYVGIDKNVDLQHEKGCSATCKLQPYCGNGKIESGEQCDTTESWCVDCKLSPDTCGNGVLDEHEECDVDAGVSAGQICLPTCQISGCRDGTVDAENGEECDDGNNSNDDMCTTKCTIPICGDGIVSEFLGEVCDDGPEGNDGAYGHCGLDCTYRAPVCGDGAIDKANGEECDDGKDNNTGGYGKCTSDCKLDIRCGDRIVQEAYEQCDDPDDLSCDDTCHFFIEVN